MKEINGGSVFYDFFRLTEGGFYSEAQEGRLLRLLSRAAGDGVKRAEQRVAALRQLQESDVGDAVRCRNFLLILQFDPDPDPLLVAAAEARLAMLEEERPHAFAGKTAWCRAIFEDDVARGLYEYASGQLAEAIESLAEALRGDYGRLALPEMLAVISREAGDAARGLEYALRAQWIGGALRVEAPHLARIEAWARKRLGAEQIVAAERAAKACGRGLAQIGFTS